MAKDATIKARVESDLKQTVESIFDKLGLTPTDAITLFYKQVALRRGLPFLVEIPNEETLQTFKDTDAGKNLVYCKNADDMFGQLDI